MSLATRVSAAVSCAPVVDLHTHLFAPSFGQLNRSGIDELLTYHYLAAELFRAEPKVSPCEYFRMPVAAQADLIWQSLFVRQYPLSEATAGVVTVLQSFGLDPRAQDLREARAFFASRHWPEHLASVLSLAGVEQVVMTNDPTDSVEREVWINGFAEDPRFLSALRLDRLLASLHGSALAEELDTWIRRMQPRYLALSANEIGLIPPEVLWACHAGNLPLALMIGVQRSVNPALKDAGDGMRIVDLAPLERLAAENPDVRFLVTTLARESAHSLCVVALKFANVLPFGCWWFMNNQSLVEETTLMRLEMLGATFVPQHSDARILEQLIYKWRHSRASIARALTRRYGAFSLPPTDAQIVSDAEALMGGIARGWLA